MNLDDRMRSAHKRQLDDITNQTRGRTFTPREKPVLQRAAPAIGFAIVALIALFGIRTLVDDGPTSIESVDSTEADSTEEDAAVTAPPEPEVGKDLVPDDSTTTTTAPESVTRTTELPATIGPGETETAPAVTEPAFEDAATEESAPEDTAPDATTSTTSPTTTRPATTTTTIAVDPGLPSLKCPSGRRAPLELSALRYVSVNEGWNRLGDLVDEQDTEFTFEAWEPGYPDEVTVEVTLGRVVDAVDIRVAQDPFTPVSGDIDITTFFDGDEVSTFAIPLAGVDGWIAHTFDATTRIDRFTITRDGESENIMEVLICVQ